LDLKDSITLGEGRGNTFIVFPKKGRKEIAVEAVNSGVVRELRRKLYQKAKQDSNGESLWKKMIGKPYSLCEGRTYVVSQGQASESQPFFFDRQHISKSC
jgi:hypothetical protein